MVCPGCGLENSDGARYCRDCGTRLSLLCSSCGSGLSDGARYCESCGALASSNTTQVFPDRPRESEPATFVGSRYLVKGLLGTGAKKRVYLVHDTLLDRDVAFALIRADGLEDTDHTRILREAQTMARLGEHPNIVPIYDFGSESDRPFMVLPVLEGGTVEELAVPAGSGQVDLDRVVGAATDICQGLAFAHSHGVVHRDLKPGNVWLTADGTAKLGDFGIAYSPAEPRVTLDNRVMGTASYMAPEQGLGRPADERSDLYSLGVMLYELATGQLPFVAENAVALINEHVHTSPADPRTRNPQCPADLQALILVLLAKDPADRPESSVAVLDRLDSIRIAARRSDDAAGFENRQIQLLIVDDSEDDALLVLRELRNGGYDVTHQRVDTPSTMKARLDSGTWDLVISDHSMPGFSAPAALKLLQSSGLDLPFIIVSGTISDDLAVSAMKAGAHDYVMKGNLARLNGAVERELREAQVRRTRRDAEHDQRRVRRELEHRVRDLADQNRLLLEQLDRPRDSAGSSGSGG